MIPSPMSTGWSIMDKIWSTYIVKESPLIPYPLKVHFLLILVLT